MENLLLLADEDLVSLYKNGDNKAFNILLDRHKNRIYTYIFRQTKDEDLANDIFQETFIKAITKIREGQYTENGKFLAWVTRIAHNLVIDFYRQDKNNLHLSNDNEEVDLLNNKSLCEQTIEDRIVEAQIHSDVRKLVDALPDSQRSVLVMRYYDNLSFKEIAEKSNVSINTALGRMRYAIMNMRKLALEHNIVLTI